MFQEVFGVREKPTVGHYLDLARTAASLPCPVYECEKSELSEKSPPETHGQILRAVLLVVPDGVPEEWVQGVCDLMVMPPHADWKEGDWRTLQDDARRFLQEWASQARRLGWEVADLLGVHPTKPTVRFDCMGLVPLLRGRAVSALTKDSAGIKVASGGSLTFRKRAATPAERCLIWERQGQP